MKGLGIVLLLALGACAASQRKPAAAALSCTAGDVDKIVAILEGKGNGAEKLLAIAAQVGPDVLACVARSSAPPPSSSSGSGSAK